MNKAQRVVIILGGLALIYLLAQYYFFYTCPIGVMCSANKQELTLRMIIVIAATAAASWLLKSDFKPTNDKPDQPTEPAQPSSSAENSSEPNSEFPKEG